MIDYRKLDDREQLNIERTLFKQGVHSKLFEMVSDGELCAVCLEAGCTCIKHKENE